MTYSRVRHTRVKRIGLYFVIALLCFSLPAASEPLSRKALQGLWSLVQEGDKFHLLVESDHYQIYRNHKYVKSDSGRYQLEGNIAKVWLRGNKKPERVHLDIKGDKLSLKVNKIDAPLVFTRISAKRAFDTEKALQGVWGAKRSNGVIFDKSQVQFFLGPQRRFLRNFRVYGEFLFLGFKGEPKEFTKFKLKGDQLELPAWKFSYKRM